MALTILHITDLHFGWDGDDAIRRAERSVCLDGLLSAIDELGSPWKPSVICLSGDVGWRGTATDYADAKKWLDRLLTTCGIGSERLIVCAGNHDAIRAEAKRNARPDDASEADEVLGVPIASQFIAPFAEFVQFCKSAQVRPMKIGAEESYLVGERVLEGYRFVSLNSAWFAKDDKDEKKLWFGLPHLRVLEAAGQLPLVRGKNDALRTIAIVHHPKEWLHPQESNAWGSRPNTWDYLAGRCHILLTGHTHGEVRRADRIAEGGYHFTGGSAYAGASHFNSFRLIRVETKQIVYLSFEFDPRSTENEWRASRREISLPLITEASSVVRSKAARHSESVGLQIRWLKEYARKLEASFFSHLCQNEHVDRAEAQIRYIEVLVRECPKDKGANEQGEAEARPLSDLAAQSGFRALVLGSGGSGKTSMLRKLAFDCCRRALADEHAPLPFFARLNFFDTHTDVFNGLLNVVAREVDLSTEELYHLWSDGSHRCLFLLDGLNEVRPEFIGDCLLALQQLTEHLQHNYLISSRPGDQATELQRQIGGIIEVEILHLDNDQIRSFLQRGGTGDLYDRMEDRLLSLARNPFLLWAIAQSCVGLPSDELPRNIGKLYENLIDRYIFGVREESKPPESRPTRYNYGLVKKPVLARLAVEMCRQGVTRWAEDAATLRSIRDHLYELRDVNAGIRSLKPHDFMPEPFAKALLDELVENGILQRHGTTLEFMHESVRDYFAGIELSEWTVEKVLQNLSPLIWRRLEPGYNELPVDGPLAQAVIMSSGLRKDTAEFLRRLFDHHPLLAAHCLADAHDIAPELQENLLKRWLALLDQRRKQYRWVGCQCLRAANLHSTEVARRLLKVIRSDSEWEVRKSAARAFAAINDTQVSKELVAQAVNDIPEYEYAEDDLGNQFRHLQTDTIVVELLTIWGDPTQTAARKRRAEHLFAKMRRSSIRLALQRLAEKPRSGRIAGDQISQLARAALDIIDSWTGGMLHAEDLRDLMVFSAGRFQVATCKMEEEMSTWPREDLITALKDSSETKRAAAARSLGARKIEATAELLDAFARERHGRVAPVLLNTLRVLDNPEELYTEWKSRIRDQRLPLLFTVGRDFADDLTDRKLSERWNNEFKQRQIELKEDSYIQPGEQGWMIRPDGGQSHWNPVYCLRLRERHVEVFDAGMRPRLVAAAEMIGPRALPVLEELLAEKDEFLDITVPEVLGKIATPEAVALLSESLSLPDHRRAVHAAITALAQTRSKQAIQPLIETLRTSVLAREFCDEVGRAIGALNGVGSLIHFAHEAGMRGDEHSRFATVCALCSCGHDDPAIEAVLLAAADDPAPRVRREAVNGLARVKSPKSEERLLRVCLKDVDQGVREDAGRALRHFPGEAGIPKLVTTLETAEDEIRVHAAEALARIQDDTAIPALLKLLQSNHVLTRIAAAKALNALSFNQVETLIQVLCPLARTAPDIKARQEAAKALCEIPGGKEKLYQPILDALNSGRYEEVIQLIGSDTPLLPDDGNLFWWRGLAGHSLKRNQNALSDLDQAIALADCSASVHRTRAEVLADLNRLPEALAAAEKAAEIEPREADIHSLVGWIAYRANELEKSVAAGRRALELNPKLRRAEFNLGLALLASGRAPEYIDAYNRGIILCAELDQQTALTDLDDAWEDLDAAVLERPQFAAGAEEAKSRLKQAREARLRPDL